jgi:hypothetical protein
MKNRHLCRYLSPYLLKISNKTITYVSANDRREDLTFGYTLLPEARDLYKVNPGSVVVFNPEKFWTKYEQKYSVLKVVGLS